MTTTTPFETWKSRRSGRFHGDLSTRGPWIPPVCHPSACSPGSACHFLFILFKSVEAECRVRRPSPSENGCVDFNVYVSVYSVGAVCFFQGWHRRKMISTRKTVFIASFQTKHVVHFKGQPFSGALLLRMCHSWFHPKKAGRLLINRRWLHMDETCLAVRVWQCERNANWTCSSLWTAQRWRRLVAPG